MATVSELLAKLPQWSPARDAVRELAKLPLATKRKEVYPQVIELAVTWWCTKDGASKCGYEVENVAEFLAKEQAVAPELSGQLADALGKKKVKLREHHFYEYARATRERRLVPHLRGLWKSHPYGWADTCVALVATELADDVLACLAENPDFSDSEIAVAAGLLAGDRAIDPLKKLFKTGFCKDGFALGLALAGHDDEKFYKALSTKGEGATAKRLWAAFHKEKQKDRVAPLDALIKEAGSDKTYVRPGLVLGCCKLLDDADGVIVERAAAAIAAYAKRGDRQHRYAVFHGYFFDRATAAIARGVSAAARKSLDAVGAAIPNAAPFADGPVAPKATPEPVPVSKKVQKGMAALAALKTTLPAKARTHRDPALEAEIAEAPDDVARYLVYADWLQTQGDPRGTLIALQAAAKTGDKTAESTAAALLVEQRHALLGVLDGVKEIELEWQFGFVRGARLKYPDQKKLLAGLEMLLEADAARFLQSIVIDPLEDKSTPEVKPLVDLLVEHAPKTISHLQVGKAGKWTIPDELRVAFPRLERDPLIVWEEVVAKIAEQKRLEIKFLDAKKLPKLQPRTGKPAADPLQILVGLRAEIEKGKPIGIAGALPRVFTKESVDAFALALVKQWTKNDDQPIAKFAFDSTGVLGGEHTARFLGENLATWSHARAVQAVDHLKRIGSDVALHQIVRLVLISDFMRPRRDHGQQVLEALAQARGGTFDDLLAEIEPADDDLYVQRAWLTRLLVHGARIEPETFTRRVAGDKVRGPLAATLVWGTFSGKQLNDTFAVARDGSLRTFEGKPYELGEGRVGLVHPLEMSKELLDSWRDTFERRELDQAILQLDRPTFRMSAKDADTDELDWFEKRRAGFTQIDTTLLGRDWYVYAQYDQGGTEAYARWFERSNVFGVASFGSSMGSIARVRIEKRDYQKRKFSNIDAVTVSELLYDLEVAHGFREGARAGSNAPAPTRGGRPASGPGPGPIVERAKTGRAKCVVCEQPIAKGDPRVGVERQIQTETFTGRGTVWSHPACRDGMPELAGVDIDALVAKL